MFYSRNKKVVEGIQNGIQQNTRNLHNSKFTSKVEQRIHKKGGEFINYSFMLTYRKWVALLNFIPLFIVFVLMTAQLMDLSFPQDVANKIFLYQGFQAMIPRFVMTMICGGLFFILVHFIFGIIHAVKYKIGMLFFDFFLAGLSGSIHAAGMWGFSLFLFAQFF